MVSSGLRSRSDKNINQFLIGNRAKGAVDADTSQFNEWRDTIDKTTLDLSKKYSDTVGNKISQPKAQNKMLEEMQDLLMSGSGKKGKMKPIFGTVDEIEIDRTTGLPFKNGFGVLKDKKPNLPLPKKIKITNPDTGKKELLRS